MCLNEIPPIYLTSPTRTGHLDKKFHKLATLVELVHLEAAQLRLRQQAESQGPDSKMAAASPPPPPDATATATAAPPEVVGDVSGAAAQDRTPDQSSAAASFGRPSRSILDPKRNRRPQNGGPRGLRAAFVQLLGGWLWEA